METQLTIFQAVLDLLCLNPWLLLGFILIGLLLYGFLKKRNHLPKARIVVSTVLLYYYLCIIFYNIVGIPTRSELLRMARLGEPLFQPNLNMLPFADGISLGFILNILCFLPLGFLCPMISRTYGRFRNMVFLGFGLSLVIEISQLFTLYRATDIDDLTANTLGVILGWLCFKLAVKMRIIKYGSKSGLDLRKEEVRLLPVLTAAAAFGITFLN